MYNLRLEIVEGVVPNLLRQYYVATPSIEEDPVLFLMLVDLVRLHTADSGGVPSEC